MKTIFVVDDNATNRLVVKNILDAAGGYRTFALPSAEAMFKLAKGVTPDLILLDVDMPDMDGFEAMDRMKTDKKLTGVPVIFLTAKNDKESVVRGVKTGARGYITKPFVPNELLTRMDELMKAVWSDREVERIVREHLKPEKDEP